MYCRWICNYQVGGVWNPINLFYTATRLCLSQASDWISNFICVVYYKFNDLKVREMIVRFVDTFVLVEILTTTKLSFHKTFIVYNY